MPFTFHIESYSTPISDVPLIIPDDVEAYMIFDDAKIKGFLKLEGQNVKSAAALACETKGSFSNHSLVIKLGDAFGAKVTTDKGVRRIKGA